MEFYEPDTSSGIDCIAYTTQLTLQEICLIPRRRRLSLSIKSASKRGRVGENWRFSSFSFPWSLAIRHKSPACYSRFALASGWKPSAWGGGKRDVARIKSISFGDVTRKQGPILRITCSRRSDSGARGKIELAPHHLNAWNGLFFALHEQYWPARTAKIRNFTNIYIYIKRPEKGYDVFFFFFFCTSNHNNKGKTPFWGLVTL